jgi:hypothetical protein
MDSTATLDPIPLSTERLSPFEALIGVLFRPYATFVKMREALVGHWWLVFVLAVLGLALSTLATAPLEAESIQAGLEASREQIEDLPEAQQAQIEQQQQIFASQWTIAVLNLIGGLIVLSVTYLIRAGVLYLLGLAFGGRASFKQVWRMAVWTTLPDVLRSIVAAVVVFARHEEPVAGLSYMFTAAEKADMSPILLTFLGGIDIYMIWSFVLMGIGLYATYQISKGKSILITVIFWVLGLAATLGFAAIGQMMTSAFAPAG